MTVFGLGDNKYQVERQWAQLPQARSLNNISAISTDNNGHIYVLQRDDPFMLVFSYDGDLVNEWFDETLIDGHYFSITSDGRVFVVDRDHHRIVIYNDSGTVHQVIGDFQHPGVLGAPFNHPTDVAITINGDIFVSDGYGNFCVHRLNATGKLINSWGKPGKGRGEFSTPHAIFVDQQDRVLVADRENNRIQLFNQDGSYLGEIKDLYHPMDIFEDKDGFIYVTDQTPTLNMFSPKGELIGRCRTFGTYGHGVTVDQNGDIYIAEMFPDCITKLVCLS